ncbi:MAG: FlgO family outer membrane protein [Spirochaetia bacterium]
MSRWLRCCIVLLFVLVVLGAPLFADINQSVLSLLTKLSRDYVQYREEVFFKIPLAVVPFVNSSPLAKQHEIGAVVDELIRSEISNSTYFILTERENLEKILEEIELSLSDFSDASQSVEVGQLTSAKIILAGSVTESGASFLLNGRLIDVETGVVIGAESVPVPKEELITEAEAFKYEYVTRYGLGFQALVGADIPFSGIPRSDTFKDFPVLIHAGTGVSYRPVRFLQIAASMNVTWSEFQYGEFDPTPTSPDYANTDWLEIYYGILTLTDNSLPTYSVEYSQKYLDAQVFYVWQPLKALTLSFGGGGLLGLYTNYIKLGNYPVYIGPVSLVTGLPESPGFGDDERFWFRKSVVIEGSNALAYGVLASFKVEYFLSPRLLLYLNVQYRKVFPTRTIRYTVGGVSAGEEDFFYELSGWIPGITPYGDDLDIGFHSIGVYLGISGSF